MAKDNNLSSLVHEPCERVAASSSTPANNLGRSCGDDDALEIRLRANLLNTDVVPSMDQSERDWMRSAIVEGNVQEEERRLLIGDQLPSALLGNHKDDSISALTVAGLIKNADGFSGVFPEHTYETVKPLQAQRYICGIKARSWLTCYQSSAEEEEYVYSSSDGSVSDVDEFVTEEEDNLATDPTGKRIMYPSRSAALRTLGKGFRKLLKVNVMEYVEEKVAKKCFSRERFKFVLETNPLSESYFLSDSMGYLFLFWLTNGPGLDYLVDEEKRQIMKFVIGHIRDQEDHHICHAYVICDLISAYRVLNGLDKQFVPLSPWFLCQNSDQDKYAKMYQNPFSLIYGHLCFGNNLLRGLKYAKRHGVRREKRGEEVFDCRVREQFNVEDLYKITEIFHYDTLESALERVKAGYPVAAGLTLFEGWNREHNCDHGEEYIYNGPDSGGKYYDEHAVIIVDYRILHNKKVAICKSSNGETIGNHGYFAVNVEIMLTPVAAAKRKNQRNWCYNKPQYLLYDFYSIDVEIGREPLIEVDPDHEEWNMKFKVEEDDSAYMPGPKFRATIEASSSVSLEKPKSLGHVNASTDDSMLHGGSLNLNIQCWTNPEWAFVDGSTGYGRENPWGIVDVDDCCGCAKYLVSFGSAGANGGNMEIKAMLPAALTSDIVSGKIQNLGLIRLLDYSVNEFPGKSKEKCLLVTKCEAVASARDSEIKSEFKASTGIMMKPKHEFVAESASQRGNAAPARRMAMTRRVHPLLSLKPYQGSWTIKVRATNKGLMRTYNNARGEGCVFNVELTDEEGKQIHATMLDAAARKFYDRFQMGKVYYITRGSLKLANKQFKTVQNDYGMTLNENSEVEEARNDNFVHIDELGAYVNQKELIDVVIGVVQSVSSTMSIRRRNDNETIPKKDTTFVDETKKTVVVSLWNELATGIGQELLDMYPVIAIKSLKVGDFQGVPLSTISRSNVVINPDSPDATELKYLYDSECKETSMSAIGSGMSSSVDNGSRSMYSDRVCLSHITSNLTLGEEKPVFFSTRAYISFIKPDQTMWYRACKTCNKKVTEAMDSGYWCEGCQKRDEECSLS